MKYFLDTEFDENGETIVPISLALVSEGGEELYMEFDFEPGTCNQWVLENVIPHLHCDRLHTRRDAKLSILEFVGGDEKPEFWAYFADYDWILFCQLFGRMVDLPHHFPHLCLDLQQEFIRLGRPDDVKPPPPSNAHNALADAKWNLDFHYRMQRCLQGRS